jgi:hypothetical protein
MKGRRERMEWRGEVGGKGYIPREPKYFFKILEIFVKNFLPLFHAPGLGGRKTSGN